MDFEHIICMKDENFFEKNRKIDNIFYLVFGRDDELKTNMDILDEHYFCNDSIKETSKKVNFPVYRDLSQFARKSTRNLYIKEAKMDILLNNEMNLGKDGYNFHTILGMASGRLTPDDLIRMLTEGNALDKGDSDSSLVEEEKQILYKDKT
jgi:hypothetical protein